MVAPAFGGRIAIEGLAAFNAASNQIQRQFNNISRSAIGMQRSLDVRGGAFFSQRTGPFSAYARLPIHLNLITIAAGVAVGAIAKLGAEFDRTSRAVEAFGDVSGKELRDITDASIELSRRINVNADDVNRAATAFAKAGAPINELGDSLSRSAVLFSEASDGEVTTAEAADLLTQAVTGLNEEWANVPHITDLIVGAVQSSTASFSDFTLGMKQLIPIAGALGWETGELTASIALLNQAGLRGSLGPTAMKNAMIALLDPSSEAREILEKYNISLFDAEGNAKRVYDIIRDLSTAFKENNDLIKAQEFFELSDVFHTRQILAALTFINQGTDAFEAMYAAQQKITAQELVDKLQSNVTDQLGILANQVSAVALAFSQELYPSLTTALKNVNDDIRGSLDSWAGYGKAVNDVLQGNNDFVNDIWQAVVPGLFALRDSIASVIDETNLFQPLDPAGWKELLTNVGVGFALVGILIEDARDEYKKLIDAKQWEPFSDDSLSDIQKVSNEIAVIEGRYKDLVAAPQPSHKSWIDELQSVVDLLVKIIAHYNAINNIIPKAMTLTPLGQFEKSLFGRGVVETSTGYELQTGYDQLKANLREALGLEDLQAQIRTQGSQVEADLEDAFNLWLNVLETLNPVLAEAVPDWEEVAKTLGTEQLEENLITPVTNALSYSAEVTSQAWQELIAFEEEEARKTIAAAGVAVASATGPAIALVGDSIESAIDYGTAKVDDANARLRARLVASYELAQQFAALFGGGAPTYAVSEGLQGYEFAGTGRTAQAQTRQPTRPPAPTRPPVGGLGSTFPPGGGGGGGAGKKGREPNLDEITADIYKLIQDIPGMTQEVARYLASIVQDFPERLQPMVGALRNSRDTLLEMVVARKDMLAVDIQILASQQRLNDLQAAHGTLQIQMSLTSIGYEKQLLGLRNQIAAIDMAAEPIRERLLMVDREIERLGRSNLGLERQRLEIDLELLPLKNQLEDIDKQISKLGRENFELSRRRLELELDSLGLKHQIEDIDRAISDLGKRDFARERAQLELQIASVGLRRQIEDIDQAIADVGRRDFALERARLELQIGSLDIRRQIEDVDRQIADLGRVNYDTVEARLRLELQLLPLRNELADIEKQLAELGKENFDLTRADVRAQLEALPIRREIRDIEDEINDLIDKRLELTSRREEIFAERGVTDIKRQLEATADALNEAWDAFDVPEILRLEAQKTALEDQLDAAEKSLQSIQDTQKERSQAEELARIELELQKVGLEELLDPIEKRRRAIADTLEEQKLLDELTRIALEEEKRLIEELIEPYQDKLDEMAREEELRNTLNEITITGLEREKQALEDLVQPYDDKLRAIEQEQEDQEYKNQIIRLGLEEERQRYIDMLRPYDDKLKAIARETEDYNQKNEVIRLGLEEERQRYIELLRPYEDKLRAIQREEEEYNKRNELVRLGLEEERQKIIDLMQPLEDKRQAIDREIEAENLRNQLMVTHLEAEKRMLQDQLIPLEDQKRAIDRITRAIELARDAALLEFQERSLQIQEMILQEQLRQAELEATRREQELLFQELVANYLTAMEESGAFSAQEAAEVAKRAGLWDEQSAKLLETISEFRRLSEEAGSAAASIASIQRDVTVTITTIHKAIYEGGGTGADASNPGATAGIEQFQHGGIVGGRGPQLVLAHGGERIISAINMPHVPTDLLMRQGRAGGGTVVNNYEYNTTYQVNPSYSQVQSPASVRDDLAALVMLTRG